MADKRQRNRKTIQNLSKTILYCPYCGAAVEAYHRKLKSGRFGLVKYLSCKICNHITRVTNLGYRKA